LELRHLRYFVAVAEELSFTRAAKRLHTSQPSLGQQIRDLEAEVGTPLFRRDRHHVEMTVAGSVLLTEARDVLSRAHHAIQMAARESKDMSLLTIGAVLAAEVKILPSLLPILGQRAKELSLVIRHFSSLEQIRELRNCSIDGGFLGGPIMDSEIDWMELLKEEIIVVLLDDHPAAKSKKVSLEKLRGLACIGTSGALSPALQQALTPFYEVAQRHITFTREAPNVLGQINLVRAGRGFAILPDYARFMLPQGVVARPLDWDPPLSVALGFAWRRSDQSKALRLFRRILVDSSGDVRSGRVRRYPA
jgi:LysR family hca operon transcriptional activator